MTYLTWVIVFLCGFFLGGTLENYRTIKFVESVIEKLEKKDG